jgi:nicotinate phosphoribosyltransferase
VFRRLVGPFDDIVGLRDELVPPGREPLLKPLMRGGLRLDDGSDLQSARERFDRDLERLPGHARRIERPVPVLARRSARLKDLIVRTEQGLTREESIRVPDAAQ